MQDQTSKYREIGKKALHEFNLYWIITAYLILLLGSFTLYRRLALEELGVDYLTYGFKLVEALVVGKLILIAQAIGLGRKYEKHPLLISIAVKSLLFALFIIVCNVAEQAIRAHFQGAHLAQALFSFTDKGLNEMLARTLVLMITLVPLIAFLELARALGPGTMSRLLLKAQDVVGGHASESRRIG